MIGICLAIATAATYASILLLMARGILQVWRRRSRDRTKRLPSSSRKRTRAVALWVLLIQVLTKAFKNSISTSRKKARFMGLWPGGAQAFESASIFMTHLVRLEMAPAYPLRPGKRPKMLAAASLSEGGRVCG